MVPNRTRSAEPEEAVHQHAAWPRGVEALVQRVLADLLGRVGGRAAGVYWLEPSGELRLRAQWPPEAEPPAALADPATPAQGDRGVAWLDVDVDGRPAGRLWVAAGRGGGFDEGALEWAAMVGRQLALVVANASLREEVRRLTAQRSALLQRTIMAQDERCRHFARELHDEVCQSLTALSIDLEAILVAGRVTDPALRQKLERAREGIVHAVEEAERIILDLRPLLLEDLGLMAALCSYAQQRLASQGVEVHLAEEASAQRLPSYLETTLYRIGQEALTNVARHAGARNVWLDFSCDGRQATLSVRDDGRGFRVEEVMQVRDGRVGLGLLGMRERAALVGGRVEITSRPGLGTSVVVTVPLGA